MQRVQESRGKGNNLEMVPARLLVVRVLRVLRVSTLLTATIAEVQWMGPQ